MQLDKFLMFSAAQALATAVGENVLDLKDCGDDLSRRLNVFAKIEGGAVTAGVSLQAALKTSADDSSWVTLATYPVKTLAELNAGDFIVDPQPLPAGILRYVRLDYTAVLDGTTPFAGDGKILAGITASLDKAL